MFSFLIYNFFFIKTAFEHKNVASVEICKVIFEGYFSSAQQLNENF